MWIFLNGRFVPREEATVSVFDHGFLYGDGVYETLRAYAGRIFMLSRHLERLRHSAHLIGLELPVPDKDWPSLIRETLERNGLGPQQTGEGSRDAYLRISVSRGEGEIGLDPGLCSQPTVVILAKPFTPYPPHLHENGVRLALVTVRRNLDRALPPQIKSLNVLNNILAKQEATRAGAFDGIMLNVQGHLTECSTSNVFFVSGGRLCTPAGACGILEGITREVVLLLAKEEGIPTEEGPYEAEVLWGAEECFVTNTTLEILPVRQIDHHTIGEAGPDGKGGPGPLTTKLQKQFRTNLSRFLE